VGKMGGGRGGGPASNSCLAIDSDILGMVPQDLLCFTGGAGGGRSGVHFLHLKEESNLYPLYNELYNIARWAAAWYGIYQTGARPS
jgi:hypothetical protein